MLSSSFSAEGDLCETLVSVGVAPVVAAGWAVRTAFGWDVGAGGATTRLFDLASLTKPMTAFVLAGSGLSREKPLDEVLHEARASASGSVSLELLLAHRAGLEAHLPLYAPLVSGGPIDRSRVLAEVLDARRADAAGPVPKEGFAPIYSDLGYILAGEALARHAHAIDAGSVIDAALGDDTLGTARSLRDRKIDFDARVVPTEVVVWRGGEIRGAVHDENAWALTRDGGSGHAGMFGTVQAVLAFACKVHDAIERTPELEWLVRERPGGTLRAGFDGKSGEGSSAGNVAGPRTFGHLGFTGTSMWIDPDARAVAVLLTNRVNPTRDNVAIRAARPKAHDALFALAAASRKGR